MVHQVPMAHPDLMDLLAPMDHQDPLDLPDHLDTPDPDLMVLRDHLDPQDLRHLALMAHPVSHKHHGT